MQNQENPQPKSDIRKSENQSGTIDYIYIDPRYAVSVSQSEAIASDLPHLIFKPKLFQIIWSDSQKNIAILSNLLKSL